MARPAPVEAAPVAAAAARLPPRPSPPRRSTGARPPAQTRRHRRAPSVNRIEAAKRGPTPDNPSLSLKKRLKRAAFFDQRDRAIAAGKAAPVSAMAGLPDVDGQPAPTVKSPRQAGSALRRQRHADELRQDLPAGVTASLHRVRPSSLPPGAAAFPRLRRAMRLGSAAGHAARRRGNDHGEGPEEVEQGSAQTQGGKAKKTMPPTRRPRMASCAASTISSIEPLAVQFAGEW